MLATPACGAAMIFHYHTSFVAKKVKRYGNTTDAPEECPGANATNATINHDSIRIASSPGCSTTRGSPAAWELFQGVSAQEIPFSRHWSGPASPRSAPLRWRWLARANLEPGGSSGRLSGLYQPRRIPGFPGRGCLLYCIRIKNQRKQCLPQRRARIGSRPITTVFGV
jgi:hypothetical protein